MSEAVPIPMSLPMQTRPIVWTIAGSDSGGGAGIQADLLTFHDLGVLGCSAITANTAQNTLTVAAINPVSELALQSQLDALLGDLPPSTIKIGLLANTAQVRIVADFLRGLRAKDCQVPVVYDPVAVASNCASMTEDSTGAAVVSELLPLCDVLTPNRVELEWLALTEIGSAGDILIAAKKLAEANEIALAVTGGHFAIEPGTTADLLCVPGETGTTSDWLIGRKIDTRDTHGTGCTYSSAVAALLAQGYPLKDACVVANAYVRRGLRLGNSAQVGEGPGPVGHCGWPSELQDFPEVLVAGSERAKLYATFDAAAAQNYAAEFAQPDSTRLGLYPVVETVQWIEKLAREGVRTLQLRIKNPGDDLREQIERAVAIGREFDLRLFINDYWQLAIECGAYGVHLGQEDLQAADLQAIQRAGLKLGISTHGFFEMLYAWQYRPSYLATGAIYATNTKDMSGQLQGPKKLARMAALLPDYPLVAIGGISVERAPVVAASGVGSIAVVTAITQAPDYQAAVAQLRAVIE
ncbi:thiamine phosphate synthase [Microbulbifer agarilyticus]|uniref:thiamine phosphate synthase n=1 Tax=Microbulbifer agarilyticus TaxID=260552 RepID=UPI001C976700|nr:thiamine phosphate synthase [Microbulbifer agarilyticus]MBY6191314.1 thiamine phosphate synthase [Microbulbifer agarilyticus]